MNEQLLQTIVKLFAILAKERITHEERINIQEFLSMHLNREATKKYMELFDSYCAEKLVSEEDDLKKIDTDDETMEFVGEWVQVTEISNQINKALTHQQKIVLTEKIIELFLRDSQLSERQSNLIYHFGEMIRIDQKVINEVTAFILAKSPSQICSENVVVAGKEPIEGCKNIISKSMTGTLLFLKVPANEIYFVKYLGEDELLFNGLPLYPGTIHVFPTGSSIKREGEVTIYYSDIIDQFVQGGSGERLTFIAENVNFKFKNGDNGIRGVNIAEEGGKLIGIMGSSGSGKTTLLNILNGTEHPHEGRVLVNGTDLHSKQMKSHGVIGYIPQDDFLIEDLSVFDNLKYAAQLCFKKLNENEIESLVLQTLKSLGLTEIKHLPVGSPLEKTISGGQRKRLNVGLELLRKPTVLFVDEPTSGLSSQDSENIMDLLKELSLRGKMVFVVIHQPSSDIYKMFDSMLILDVGGYPIYYGNPLEAIVHFKETVNMVNSAHGACPECGNVNPEQIFNIIETKVVNEYGRFTDSRKVSPQQWNEIYLNKFPRPKVKPSRDKLNVAHEIPNWAKQFSVFLKRDIFSKLNNSQYVIINLLEAPVLALFLSMLVKYNQGEGEYTYYSNNNIPIFLFISVVVALFMGLTVSAKEIIKDQKILKREKFLHLSRSSYLTSKVTIMFLISAVQTGLFAIISCYTLEIKGMFLPFWFILFAVSCASNMMGLNVSSAFRSTITVYILIPILLIPQLILSGVVVNFDRFNPQFANQERVPAIGDWITSRWAFEALMVKFFKDNEFEQHYYEYEKAESDARYFNLFYLEALTTQLGELTRAFKDDSLSTPEAQRQLEIVKNEFETYLEEFGQENFPEFEKIEVSSFDVSVLTAGLEFLNAVQRVYNKRRDQATRESDSVTTVLLNQGIYEDLRNSHFNEELSALVRDSYSTLKIVKGQMELVRKYEPIYADPKPRYFLDYRTSFYSPQKHFAGKFYHTSHFNSAVIWLMAIGLYISLYFNIPRIIVSIFERISRR